MGAYDAFSDLAVDLLAEFGDAATLRRVSRAYDVASGKTSNTTADIAVRAVLKEVAARNENGELSITTQATLAAKTTASAPQVDDLLVMAGKTYRIVTVLTSAPIGEAITYKLVLGAA